MHKIQQDLLILHLQNAEYKEYAMKNHYNFILFNKFTTITDAAFIASDIFSRWDSNLETQSLKEIRNNDFVDIYT